MSGKRRSRTSSQTSSQSGDSAGEFGFFLARVDFARRPPSLPRRQSSPRMSPSTADGQPSPSSSSHQTSPPRVPNGGGFELGVRYNETPPEPMSLSRKSSAESISTAVTQFPRAI